MKVSKTILTLKKNHAAKKNKTAIRKLTEFKSVTSLYSETLDKIVARISIYVFSRHTVFK